MIAFICDEDIPNYLTHPDRYKYLPGKHSATAYYYWILVNNGVTGLKLVDPSDDLSSYSGVVVYYDNKECISRTSGKVIQVVSDRPQIEGCDGYVVSNYSCARLVTDPTIAPRVGFGLKGELVGNLFYVHYPMAANVVECHPQWPPKIFHFSGRENTLIPEIRDRRFVDHMYRRYGIYMRFGYDIDGNIGDEDVYFCVRDKHYVSPTSDGFNVDTQLGHKTANRLYQSWKMGTPLIHHSSTALGAIRRSQYDFLIADTAVEFEGACGKLVTDQSLFKRMIDVCKQRRDEHSNEIITQQWMACFQQLGLR